MVSLFKALVPVLQEALLMSTFLSHGILFWHWEPGRYLDLHPHLHSYYFSGALSPERQGLTYTPIVYLTPDLI